MHQLSHCSADDGHFRFTGFSEPRVQFFDHGIVTQGDHRRHEDPGAVTQRFRYDEFGTRTTQVGVSNQYGYTGEEFDNETGLLYLRARYYDPSLGRFISNDPYWGRLEEPVTQNRYIYVQNSPLLHSDPSGLRPMTGCEMNFGGNCYEPDVTGPYQGADPIVKASVEYMVTVASFVPSPVQPLFLIPNIVITAKNIYQQFDNGNIGEGTVLAATASLSTSSNPWIKGAGFLFDTANFGRSIDGVPPLDKSINEVLSNMPTPPNSGKINRTPIYLLSETGDGC